MAKMLSSGSNVDVVALARHEYSELLEDCASLLPSYAIIRRIIIIVDSSCKDAYSDDEIQSLIKGFEARNWLIKTLNSTGITVEKPILQQLLSLGSGTNERIHIKEFVVENNLSVTFPTPLKNKQSENPYHLATEFETSINPITVAIHSMAYESVWKSSNEHAAIQSLSRLSREGTFDFYGGLGINSWSEGLLKDKTINRNQLQEYLEFLGFQVSRIYIAESQIEIPTSIIELPGHLSVRVLAELSINPNALTELPPYQFEQLVAELLERDKWDTQIVGGPGDGGVDIYAKKKFQSLEILCLVQCKRHAKDRPVGISVIRELYGVIEIKRATAGMIVTSSRLTKPAREHVQELRHRMSAIEHDNLVDWLKSSNGIK